MIINPRVVLLYKLSTVKGVTNLDLIVVFNLLCFKKDARRNFNYEKGQF